MYKQIDSKQRIQLDLLLSLNHPKVDIAKKLGCSRKTIYNEINRNSSVGSYKLYNSNQAQKRRDERRLNSNKSSTITSEMIAYLETSINKKQWSPEQIVGRCLLDGIPMVSHETIYKYIYTIDKSNQGSMISNLRQSHRTRRRRRNSKDKRGTIKERISIDNRPEIVDLQERYGDFEGDTIVGKGHQSQVATIVERKSLYTIIAPLKTKESTHVAQQIVKKMQPFILGCHTITFDNGKEFAGHKIIANELKTDIYFAHPYSSWERGCNENTNGLIRQYAPKGTDLNLISNAKWKVIENKLNDRPRKKLGFQTPKEVYLQSSV
jgi:transposase, IS30 family